MKVTVASTTVIELHCRRNVFDWCLSTAQEVGAALRQPGRWTIDLISDVKTLLLFSCPIDLTSSAQFPKDGGVVHETNGSQN